MLRAFIYYLAITTSFASLAGEPPSPANLSLWSQIGNPSNGQWNVQPSGNTVIQTINQTATGFVSHESFEYQVFTGRIRVDAGDDDFIGYIVGYASGQFHVFHWKKNNQEGAIEGFHFFKVNGSLETINACLWNHAEAPCAGISNVYHNHGGGWQAGRDYTFQIEISPDRFIAKVDGAVIFDVNETIAKGRFGFFNASQAGVTYGDVFQQNPPIVESISTALPTGQQKIITGEFYDLNVTETHTCEIIGTPPHGTITLLPPCSFKYVSDPNIDGTFTLKYKVTDSSGLSNAADLKITVKDCS